MYRDVVKKNLKISHFSGIRFSYLYGKHHSQGQPSSPPQCRVKNFPLSNSMENPNNPTVSVTLRWFPGSNRFTARLHQSSPEKTGTDEEPFFPFSILQAIKVEICHSKGSIREIFQAFDKANFPLKTPNNRDRKKSDLYFPILCKLPRS